MVNDLSADLEYDGATWPAQSVAGLQDSVNELQKRLGNLSDGRSMRAKRE
jgi:hypothetical protein